MLNQIRKASDKFIMRFILGMIAFAFIGWGIKDVLQTTNDYDLVTFSDAENITQTDFLKEKAAEINNIQKQTNSTLSEEEIKQLNIDNIVMKRLINNSILKYLVRYYSLDLSDDTVIQLLKESPIFKNEQGMFDIKIFKAAFKNSYNSEEEYLLNIKEKALIDIAINSFLLPFQTPKIMIKNIIDYMAETRNVELVEIDLKTVPKNVTIPSPTDEQIQDFYKNNQGLFEVAESRSFYYIKISNQFLQKKIIITKDELLEFYNENKEDFGNQNFAKAETAARNLLKQQKLEELIGEFTKNLEDNVAAGLSLTEIAEKYDIPIQQMDNVTYQDLTKTDIAESSDSIFELTEEELSYPIEIQNKDSEGNTIMLAQLKSIQPTKIEELALVKEKVAKLWLEKYLANFNWQLIENIAKDYTPDQKNVKEYAISGVTINSAASFTRSDISENNQNTFVPIELLISIFQARIGTNSPIFQMGNKAYFAHIKSIKIDSKKGDKINQDSGNDIANTIQNCVVEELIGYLAKQNNMKVSAK